MRTRSPDVIGYRRVSTEEQAQSEFGLADQRAAKWPLGAADVGVFRYDPVRSAWRRAAC